MVRINARTDMNVPARTGETYSGEGFCVNSD